MIRSRFPLVALVLSLCAPAAFGSLVQNGSFESPGLPAGAVLQVAPTGWSWVGTAGFLFGAADGAIKAQDGQQFVDIGNTPAFSLQQVLTVGTAGRHVLTWYDNANTFFQVAPYTVTVSGVVADAPFDANEGIDGTWNERSLLLDLAAGSYTLSFTPANIPGPLPAQDRFIDNVSLAVVPVPPAFGLLGAALLGLAGLGRRRAGFGSGAGATPAA
jgi:hypothetical protein